MRIATWNVNSLMARLEVVERWLERADPDVLLLQETKLTDAKTPDLSFRMAGYELVHHGEGRWNGVAIASREPLSAVVTNFGDGPVGTTGGEEADYQPLRQARMISAISGGIRFVSLYAPNGRQVGTEFYAGKLAWLGRVRDWLDENCSPDEPLVVGGDLNVTPGDDDVWDARAAHGGTHVSAPEREALAALRAWGLTDAYRLIEPGPGRYTWWDYRAGMFQKNMGMRLDLLYFTRPLVDRVIWSEIDREARKGKPTPSDHAPVVVDLDEPGRPFEAGWEAALQRIAERRR